MPIPGSTFLIAMGRADRAVHVQHDVLQPIAVMEPVDPLPVQVGQRRPVLGHSKRLGLEPSHLRGRCRLRVNGTAAHDLAHDRVNGQSISIVDVLVSSQSPEHRLPKQPVKTMDGVLAASGVSQRRCRQIGQPERVIKLPHHE